MTASADRARYPDLAGRTVFVSGGGSGIGAAFVRCVRGAGLPRRVHRHRRRAVAGARGRARRRRSATGAATSATSTRSGPRSRRPREAFGPVRVLVNNAARDDRHKFDDVTPEYWDDNQAVNLRHQFFAAQAVAPQMAGAGGGSIINLGSVSWMRGRPEHRRLHDGEGRDQRADAHARARARRAQHPRQLHRARRDRHRAPARAVGLARNRSSEFLDQQCLKFRLSEDDVARTALFLASDEARGITGQNLIVDAGLAQTSADAHVDPARRAWPRSRCQATSSRRTARTRSSTGSTSRSSRANSSCSSARRAAARARCCG